jgi:hypothetical protein
MLAWGIAPGIRLLIHQALKARPNAARVTGPNIIPVEINEVNRAFSAGAFRMT